MLVPKHSSGKTEQSQSAQASWQKSDAVRILVAIGVSLIAMLLASYAKRYFFSAYAELDEAKTPLQFIPLLLLHLSPNNRSYATAWGKRFFVLLASQLVGYGTLFLYQGLFTHQTTFLYIYFAGLVSVLPALAIPLWTTEDPKYYSPTLSRTQLLKIRLQLLAYGALLPAIFYGTSVLFSFLRLENLLR